eukprot:jgi/Mesvir1/14810/Mv05446-RA.1
MKRQIGPGAPSETGSTLIASSLSAIQTTLKSASVYMPRMPARRSSVTARLPEDRMVADEGPWLCLKDFRALKEIGHGRLSTVWSGECNDTGLTFAIKRYHKSLIMASGSLAPSLRQNIQREVSLLKTLRGIPSICHLYGTFEDAEGVYLVQEYCPGGDLLGVLKKCGGHVPEHVFVPLVLAPLLKCLQHVHEKGVMHRDLKPENIFIDGAGHPRLGDFGLGINFLQGDVTQRVGTLDYMAPEVVIHSTRNGNSNPPYTYKIDTWAVGILSYEMLTGRPPFEVASESNTAALILWTDVPINGVWPPQLSVEAISFIRSALRKVPNSRPSAAEMLRHPWLIKYCPDLAKEKAARAFAPATARVSTSQAGGFRMSMSSGSLAEMHATRRTTLANGLASTVSMEAANASSPNPESTSTSSGSSIPCGVPHSNSTLDMMLAGRGAALPGGPCHMVVPNRHSISDTKAARERHDAIQAAFMSPRSSPPVPPPGGPMVPPPYAPSPPVSILRSAGVSLGAHQNSWGGRTNRVRAPHAPVGAPGGRGSALADDRCRLDHEAAPGAAMVVGSVGSSEGCVGSACQVAHPDDDNVFFGVGGEVLRLDEESSECGSSCPTSPAAQGGTSQYGAESSGLPIGLPASCSDEVREWSEDVTGESSTWGPTPAGRTGDLARSVPAFAETTRGGAKAGNGGPMAMQSPGSATHEWGGRHPCTVGRDASMRFAPGSWGGRDAVGAWVGHADAGASPGVASPPGSNESLSSVAFSPDVSSQLSRAASSWASVRRQGYGSILPALVKV